MGSVDHSLFFDVPILPLFSVKCMFYIQTFNFYNVQLRTKKAQEAKSNFDGTNFDTLDLARTRWVRLSGGTIKRFFLSSIICFMISITCLVKTWRKHIHLLSQLFNRLVEAFQISNFIISKKLFGIFLWKYLLRSLNYLLQRIFFNNSTVKDCRIFSCKWIILFSLSFLFFLTTAATYVIKIWFSVWFIYSDAVEVVLLISAFNKSIGKHL